MSLISKLNIYLIPWKTNLLYGSSWTCKHKCRVVPVISTRCRLALLCYSAALHENYTPAVCLHRVARLNIVGYQPFVWSKYHFMPNKIKDQWNLSNKMYWLWLQIKYRRVTVRSSDYIELIIEYLELGNSPRDLWLLDRRHWGINLKQWLSKCLSFYPGNESKFR